MPQCRARIWERGKTLIERSTCRVKSLLCEEITFRLAKRYEVWLQTGNAAGAHVVIVCAGREIPECTVKEAVALAAQYSPTRHDSRREVIIAPRRHRVAEWGLAVKASAIVTMVR
jgi:hypothetical protein